MSIEEAVTAAFDKVHDPCSVAAGRPLSLRQMGLVRSWRLEEGVLHIRFAVTFPGCTMAPHFMNAARRELLLIAGIRDVEMTVDTNFVWTPFEIAGDAVIPMRGEPQAWRKHASGQPA